MIQTRRWDYEQWKGWKPAKLREELEFILQKRYGRIGGGYEIPTNFEGGIIGTVLALLAAEGGKGDARRHLKDPHTVLYNATPLRWCESDGSDTERPTYTTVTGKGSAYVIRMKSDEDGTCKVSLCTTNPDRVIGTHAIANNADSADYEMVCLKMMDIAEHDYDNKLNGKVINGPEDL